MNVDLKQGGWVSISNTTDVPLERFEVAFYYHFGFFPDDEIIKRISSEEGRKIVSWLAFPVAV